MVKKDIYQHMARYPPGKAISVTARCMIGISDKFHIIQMITDEPYITLMININLLFKTNINNRVVLSRRPGNNITTEYFFELIEMMKLIHHPMLVCFLDHGVSVPVYSSWCTLRTTLAVAVSLMEHRLPFIGWQLFLW